MKIESSTSDPLIRSALHSGYLRRTKARPDTLVIDELGLAHSRGRIDVAVINGYVHGYEIKSAKDKLERLDSQVKIYQKTLQKLTIVAAPRHVIRVLTHTPEWCGVLEVGLGPRNGIHFSRVRSATRNPDIDPVMLAHLLWRTEVVHLLSEVGYTPNDLRRPRKQLYEMLCEALTLRELTDAIRAFMAKRKAWRGRPVLASYGG